MQKIIQKLKEFRARRRYAAPTRPADIYDKSVVLQKKLESVRRTAKKPTGVMKIDSMEIL